MRVTTRHGRTLAVVVAGALCALAATAGTAAAQALTPMRGQVKSVTDQFAFRVFPANPYKHKISIEVRVYDENFAPVAARVMPAAATLAPEDNRSFMVVVPFDGLAERKVRICAESIPFANTATRLRTQVCGRFFAQRLR